MCSIPWGPTFVATCPRGARARPSLDRIVAEGGTGPGSRQMIPLPLEQDADDLFSTLLERSANTNRDGTRCAPGTRAVFHADLDNVNAVGEGAHGQLEDDRSATEAILDDID
jgi:hypothetical protein